MRTPRLKLRSLSATAGRRCSWRHCTRRGDQRRLPCPHHTTRILRTAHYAERTDSLGLCRRIVARGRRRVLVVPERVPLAFLGTGSSGRLGQHLRMKAFGQTGSEFHSQREYTPGDDLRRINWKTSARAGTLIVRETAMEGVQRCVVVLDTFADEYDDNGFERAVTAAASVVAAASAVGIATRLVSPGIDLRGPDVAPHSLRWLATVAPGQEVVDHTASGQRALTDWAYWSPSPPT